MAAVVFLSFLSVASTQDYVGLRLASSFCLLEFTLRKHGSLSHWTTFGSLVFQSLSTIGHSARISTKRYIDGIYFPFDPPKHSYYVT